MRQRWFGGILAIGLILAGAGAVWAVAQPGDVPVTLNEDESNHAITLASTTTTADATVTWTLTGGPSHGSLAAAAGSLTCTSGDCTGTVD